MEQRQTHSYHGADQRENRGKRTFPLMMLLLVLFMFTSGIAGYMLGKRTGSEPSGQLIDTILLDPGQEVNSPAILHLAGQALYSDGTPAAGRTMELHSAPVTTVTDSTGMFLFSDVTEGEHHVYVLDDDGAIAAERKIVLEHRQEAEGVSISMGNDGEYVIQLAVDVRLLEISIEVEQGTVYINPEKFTYAKNDGWVITPEGIASIENGPVVTPVGNICLPDRTIVLAGGTKGDPTAVILPDDTVIYPKTPYMAGENKIDPEGVVHLADGTEIEPGGQITSPSGEVYGPGTGGSQISDSKVIPIGQAPTSNGAQTTAEGQPPQETGGSPNAQNGPAYTEGRADSPVGAEHPGPSGNGMDGDSKDAYKPSPDLTEQEETKGDSGNSGGGSGGGHGGGSHGSGGTVPGTEGSSSPETESGAEDKGTLNVSGQIGNTSEFVSWTQTGIIDLFYNRQGGEEVLLAPGSSGYYIFQLENSRDEDLAIHLILTEGPENHLPLTFKLASARIKGELPDVDAAKGTLSGENKTLVLETSIKANETVRYRLDWEWPLNGNEKEDTAAGEKSGAYTLTLTIHAEGGV
ncbi:hypothetical protein V3C10_07470 [[Clostridium] symbiosum]|uniref:hypothetical protein n=1 Tax=Clostridium symbiosum TaxID=1512 RepID=UPI001D0994F5|nr:hypothetical protein [[Clostridium] symbiosum]MCB6607209.1 hypothetical protein [[Clostridium] symbiosum]MCB6929769.1 hypothetical protein [[Clostridium] symbiosum]